MAGAATRRNAGSDPKIEQLGGELGETLTPIYSSLQLLRERHLARRLRLPPNVIHILAALAFETGGTR